MPVKPIDRKRKFAKTLKPRNLELEKLLDNYGKVLDQPKPVEKPSMWDFGPHMIPDFSVIPRLFEKKEE